MPSNHRNVPTGDNHRPTPRIAQLLANDVNAQLIHTGAMLNDANPMFRYSDKLYPNKFFSYPDAQKAINDYRHARDMELPWADERAGQIKRVIQTERERRRRRRSR